MIRTGKHNLFGRLGIHPVIGSNVVDCTVQQYDVTRRDELKTVQSAVDVSHTTAQFVFTTELNNAQDYVGYHPEPWKKLKHFNVVL